MAYFVQFRVFALTLETAMLWHFKLPLLSREWSKSAWGKVQKSGALKCRQVWSTGWFHVSLPLYWNFVEKNLVCPKNCKIREVFYGNISDSRSFLFNAELQSAHFCIFMLKARALSMSWKICISIFGTKCKNTGWLWYALQNFIYPRLRKRNLY